MDNSNMKILLVDDDDVAQEAVIRSFKKYNLPFPVITANDGLEALEILRNEHPHKKIDGPFIVLLDLNMPRMNGFEFLQTIRSDDDLSTTIVFVLTTSGRDSDRTRAYQEFIAGYLVKSSVGPQFSKLANLMNQYAVTIDMP